MEELLFHRVHQILMHQLGHKSHPWYHRSQKLLSYWEDLASTTIRLLDLQQARSTDISPSSTNSKQITEAVGRSHGAFADWHWYLELGWVVELWEMQVYSKEESRELSLSKASPKLSVFGSHFWFSESTSKHDQELVASLPSDQSRRDSLTSSKALR